MTNKKVTISELAEITGMQKTYLMRLARKGILKFSDTGLINPVEAQAAIDANSDPKKEALKARHKATREAKKRGPKPAPLTPVKAADSGMSYAEARVMRESMQAKIAELDYRKAKGELVEAKSVIQAVTDAAVQIRSSLELIPDKLAIIVAAESDAAKCHELITAEVEATLTELTKLMEAGGKTGS